MPKSVPNPPPRDMRDTITKSWHIMSMLWPLDGKSRTLPFTWSRPWPCNGEDPWLSSKGCTTGVGKAVLGSHGTSSTVWSDNGPCCGTIAYFVGGKRGKDLVSYNMYQTLTIWEDYLVVFANPGIYYEICPKIYHVEGKKKDLKKNSWSPEICVRPTSWR